MFAELLYQVRVSRRMALRETGLRREYWFENARRLLQLARAVRSRSTAEEVRL